MVDSDHEIDAGVLVFQRLSQAAPQGTPLVDLVLWTICEVTLRHEPHNDSSLNRYDTIDGTAITNLVCCLPPPRSYIFEELPEPLRGWTEDKQP